VARTRSQSEVIGGVDSHAATHQGAVLDRNGRLFGCEQFPATPSGYSALLSWMRSFGHLERVGVEGTGAYGAGLARYLHHQSVTVIEVPRPDRRLRRQAGKSDPIDAEAAARAVLAGTATAEPKLSEGPIEAVRALRVARNGAIKAKTAATNTLHNMAITAPECLRAQLPARSGLALVAACLRLRPDMNRLDDPVQATKAALRSIAQRARALAIEARQLEAQLEALTRQVAPATTAVFALGPDTTSALLVTIGDNPDRLRSEAAFAHLCGTSRPAPARPTDTGSTAAATAPPTRPSTSPSSSASAITNPPAAMQPAADPRGYPCPKSSAASSATWPAKSSPPSEPTT
jgi:transposase